MLFRVGIFHAQLFLMVNELLDSPESFLFSLEFKERGRVEPLSKASLLHLVWVKLKQSSDWIIVKFFVTIFEHDKEQVA